MSDAWRRIVTFFKHCVLGLVVYVVIMGAYGIVYESELDSAKRKLTHLEELRATSRQLQVTAAKYREFAQEMELLRRKLENLELILPSEPRVEELTERIRRVARQTGLLLLKARRIPGRSAEFYVEIPLEVDVSGPRGGFAPFLRRLGRDPRLVVVGGIELERTEADQFRGRMTLTAFSYPLETPARAPKR